MPVTSLVKQDMENAATPKLTFQLVTDRVESAKKENTPPLTSFDRLSESVEFPEANKPRS